MKNGYKLKLKCIECGVTFESSALPTQLLAENLIIPKRCRSCQRAKRDRVENTRRPKSRPRKQ